MHTMMMTKTVKDADDDVDDANNDHDAGDDDDDDHGAKNQADADDDDDRFPKIQFTFFEALK